MTKKHFQKIAEVIAEIRDPEDREHIAYTMAVFLKKVNPRFDCTRFYEACQISKAFAKEE